MGKASQRDGPLGRPRTQAWPTHRAQQAPGQPVRWLEAHENVLTYFKIRGKVMVYVKENVFGCNMNLFIFIPVQV